MQVQVFLDCSASMGKDNPKKAAYAVASVAAMAFLAVHNMDKLTINLMKGNRSENPFGMIIGKNAFFRSVSELENTAFDEETFIDKCVMSCPDTSVGNGLSVIVSDFFTDSDWKKAVDYLRYRKRQVLLVQILTPDEDNPTYDGRMNLIDSESVDISDNKNMKLRITRSMQRAYQEALKDMKQDLKSFCSKRGADFITVRTDMPIEKVLFGELLKVGVMS